jgi:hypothetical protein
MPELGLMDVQLLEYLRTISEDWSNFEPFPKCERDLEDNVPRRSARLMMMMIVKKCLLLQNLQAFLDLDIVAQENQVAVVVEGTQVVSPNLLLKTCKKLVVM